jgi:hypothetical protein
MTPAVPGPAALDAVEAVLAPDLVAIIGYLTAPDPEPAPPAVTDEAARAPEVVKVRLSGERAGIETVLTVLARACEVGACPATPTGHCPAAAPPTRRRPRPG